MRIVICPHAALPSVAKEAGPARIVVLHSPGRVPPAPSGLAPIHRAAFHDVSAARPGLVPAREDDLAAILAFADVGPVLVSCEMGVSRSTAVAIALACRARPERPEREIAAEMRHACPVATPNPLLITFADRLLDRGGRLVAAVAAIGRGADYAPYRCTALDLDRVAA